MDISRIIRELGLERDRVQRIIQSLEEMAPSNNVEVEGAKHRRGRKSVEGPPRTEVAIGHSEASRMRAEKNGNRMRPA